MRRLPIFITLALAAAAGLSSPLQAQPAPALPENLPAAPQLNDNQIKVIQDFVASRAAALTSADASEVSRARAALVAPLHSNTVTVRFRIAYAQALGDALRAAIGGTNEQQAVNALRLAGELATPSAVVLIQPALTDARPAIRYAASFAAARLFDAVARHEPAPSPEQLTKLIRDLRLPLESEADPIVTDGLVLALTSASRIRDDKFRDQNPSVRAVALLTLARGGTVKARDLSKNSAPCPTLGALQRTLRTMRDALADVGQPPLPAETLREVGSFTAEVIKAVAALSAAGTACDADQLKQATAAAESVRKLAGG